MNQLSVEIEKHMILEGNGFTTDEMHPLCALIISHISHHCCSLIHSYINNWIHGGFHGYESLYQYHHFTAQQWRPVLILGRKSSPWAPYSSIEPAYSQAMAGAPCGGWFEAAAKPSSWGWIIAHCSMIRRMHTRARAQRDEFFSCKLHVGPCVV